MAKLILPADRLMLVRDGRLVAVTSPVETTDKALIRLLRARGATTAPKYRPPLPTIPTLPKGGDAG